MQNSELHRHQCEVRHYLATRVEKGAGGRDWLRRVLDDIERKRGRAAAQRLKDDIVTQWQAGNRGAPGDWRVA